MASNGLKWPQMTSNSLEMASNDLKGYFGLKLFSFVPTSCTNNRGLSNLSNLVASKLSLTVRISFLSLMILLSHSVALTLAARVELPRVRRVPGGLSLHGGRRQVHLGQHRRPLHHDQPRDPPRQRPQVHIVMCMNIKWMFVTLNMIASFACDKQINST